MNYIVISILMILLVSHSRFSITKDAENENFPELLSSGLFYEVIKSKPPFSLDFHIISYVKMN